MKLSAQPNQTPEHRSIGDQLLYNAAYWSSFFALTLGSSMRATGRENVPQDGSLLLVSNHSSALDPLIVGTATPRYLSFLAKQELFRNRFAGALLRHLGATPINRDVGTDGLKKGCEVLADGKAMLVFPEGERSKDGKTGPLKPGISLLIKKSRAPVLPVGVAGSFEAMSKGGMPRLAPLPFGPNPAAIGVAFGKAIDPDMLADMERGAMLEFVRERILECVAAAEEIRRK